MEITLSHKWHMSESRKKSLWLVAGSVGGALFFFWFVHVHFLVEFFATFVNLGFVIAGAAFGVFLYHNLPEGCEKWSRLTSAIVLACAATLCLMYLTRSWHMVHDFRWWHHEIE
jgi:hypothetical protein